jgi:hypothetical protein
MDPHLEHPTLWPDVHNSLAIAIADAVTPQIAPRYYVALGRRTYLIEPNDYVFFGHPDLAADTERATALDRLASGILEVSIPTMDETHENYLKVCETKSGDVVTVLELLSPANKLHSEGRKQYEQKRNQILATHTSLVEVDLLRAGKPMTFVGKPIHSDYRILISRGWQRPRAQLYAFNLRSPIPQFPLPLQRGEIEPLVDLNTVLHELYTRARFDLRLDYEQPPVPPLGDEDAVWAAMLGQPPQDPPFRPSQQD